MLPTTGVDEALDSLLSQVETLAPRTYSIEQALGLVLAEPLVAGEEHPVDDTSAMDGYAVRTEDLQGASETRPVHLRQLEDIKAGSPPTVALKEGLTSRISTGGLVPEGADAVVMREVVEVTTEGIRFVAPADSGQNIRYAGEHIKSGEVVVGSGTVMGACEVGMAAFLGVEQVQVVPPVSVAVLSTGSELIASGAVLQKGQIRDSNGISLASALRQMGCRVTMQTRVPDHADALDQALEEAFSKSQVVLTSGGISAGWHDLVRGRIEKMGGEFSFHKLRMRPGKPLAFGHCGDSHFFCLPGNPVSSMVTFEVFAKPALRKMAGLDPLPQTLRARLTERIVKREGFTIFYRGYMEARPDGNRVRLTGPQGSHMLRSLVEANVLVRTEECDRVLEADSIVTVLPLKGA